MTETDPTPAEVVATAPAVSARSDFASVVGQLAGVNGVVMLCAIVTGPVTARALGAEGRGELAAIVAVLTMGPWLLDLGVGQWLARERARGGDRGELLGAALPVAFCFSLISVFVAIPLANAIGGEREIVVTFLKIGLLLMPLSVVLYMLSGVVVGESRWGLYSAARLLGSILPVIVIVTMTVAGSLTVGVAAAAYLVSGFLGSLLLLRVVRGVRRLSFSLRRSLVAAKFGARSWLGQVAGTANIRLDQVLMAGLVSSSELGLYAVAVTVGSIAFGLIQAVSAASFPRVAGGDPELAARACRVTVLIVAAASLVLAAITPAMVPFVFGADFKPAVPMVLILLVASIPLAAAIVLSSALVAANDPGATMRAELVALAITIPALIIFLPGFGGQAAALVSVAAYSVRVVIQLRAARRAFARPMREFLLPEHDDLGWLVVQARRTFARHR